MRTYLDFEKAIAEIENKVAELRAALRRRARACQSPMRSHGLRPKAHDALESTYLTLDPWQKTQVARHPQRPHCMDYVDSLLEEYTPLAGDRYFAEDHALIGGLGRLRGRSVMVIGQEKGSDTESRLKHNFGMARPEGYRKAIRLMELADRFNLAGCLPCGHRRRVSWASVRKNADNRKQ